MHQIPERFLFIAYLIYKEINKQAAGPKVCNKSRLEYKSIYAFLFRLYIYNGVVEKPAVTVTDRSNSKRERIYIYIEDFHFIARCVLSLF